MTERADGLGFLAGGANLFDGLLQRGRVTLVVPLADHGQVLAQTLKRIATEARQDMERLFDGKVFLEIFVRVKSGWSDDERFLKSLGYE